MNKQEFLNELRQGLNGLPQYDIEERVSFYSEMIDDRIEEGFSEADAVAAVGSIADIVFQVVSDTPLTKIVKQRTKNKKERNRGGGCVFVFVRNKIVVSLWLLL